MRPIDGATDPDPSQIGVLQGAQLGLASIPRSLRLTTAGFYVNRANVDRLRALGETRLKAGKMLF